jgi:hypothetical protein
MDTVDDSSVDDSIQKMAEGLIDKLKIHGGGESLNLSPSQARIFLDLARSESSPQGFVGFCNHQSQKSLNHANKERCEEKKERLEQVAVFWSEAASIIQRDVFRNRIKEVLSKFQPAEMIQGLSPDGEEIDDWIRRFAEAFYCQIRYRTAMDMNQDFQEGARR